MARADGFGGVDLTEQRYTVKQSLVHDRYRVYDHTDELLLEADRREFRAQQEFHFRDSDGDVAFSVQEGNIDDDFFIIPPGTDSPLVILERDSTLLNKEWNVRHGSNERLLATIESRGPMLEFVRGYVPMMGVLPHTYRIANPEGEKLGELTRRFSIADTYELAVEPVDDIAPEPLVTAAISIDVLDDR